MDLSSLSFSGLLFFGLAAVLKEQILICFKVLAVYVKAFMFGREYNLDGDKGTSDWCEAYNPGDGKWGLMEIVSYRLLSVGTIMRDSDGELHPRDFPILEWISTRLSRRHVSQEQKEAIKKAANQWPSMEIKEDEFACCITDSEREGVVPQSLGETTLTVKLEDDTSEDIKALAGAIDNLINALATKKDTEEIKLLIDVKAELEKTKAMLNEWKEKRPIELGRVKSQVAKLSKQVNELETKPCCNDKKLKVVDGAIKA